MTERVAFVLTVRPDRIDDYVDAHRAVWPELLAELRAAGVRNYTIFRAGTSFFGYYETDDSAAVVASMSTSEVNARWQHEMLQLVEQGLAHDGPLPLTEIFRME